MKKIATFLAPILLAIIFTSPVQAKNINYGPVVSGKLEKSVLFLKGTNNPFRIKIHVRIGEKKPFSEALASTCNRKFPPDCFFSFNFAEDLNCKALGACKASKKIALRKIQRGKRFAATASYTNKKSVTKKTFSCQKNKGKKISCRVKKY